jgi:hypothetical protein
MVNSKYKIDLSDYYSEDGGYCTLFKVSHQPFLGFKEFISKSRAEYARKIQIKLSKYDLAPKVYSELCKMGYEPLFTNQISGWGYITELAKPTNVNIQSWKIQRLVDTIYDRTKLKFWDCHSANIGYIIREGKKKLVCIDTGKETWDGYANYFGNSDPGPKCSYCLKYQCKCEGI